MQIQDRDHHLLICPHDLEEELIRQICLEGLLRETYGAINEEYVEKRTKLLQKLSLSPSLLSLSNNVLLSIKEDIQGTRWKTCTVNIY